jgi:hypothetical protein
MQFYMLFLSLFLLLNLSFSILASDHRENFKADGDKVEKELVSNSTENRPFKGDPSLWKKIFPALYQLPQGVIDIFFDYFSQDALNIIFKKPPFECYKADNTNMRGFTMVYNQKGDRILLSDFHEAKVWDEFPYIGKRIFMPRSCVIPRFERSIKLALFAPTEDRILIASSNKVQLWKILGDEKPIEFHTGNDVLSVAFNKDGSRMIIAEREGSIALWDMLSIRCINILRSGPIEAAAINANGDLVAIAGSDGKAYIWDVLHGDHCYTFYKKEGFPQGRICSIAFSHQGIMCTGDDRGKAKLWDSRAIALIMAEWCPKKAKPIGEFYHGRCIIKSVAFNQAGDRIMTVSDDKICLWDIHRLDKATEIKAQKEHGGKIEFATLNSAGDEILVKDNDQVKIKRIEIKLFDRGYPVNIEQFSIAYALHQAKIRGACHISLRALGFDDDRLRAILSGSHPQLCQDMMSIGTIDDSASYFPVEAFLIDHAKKSEQPTPLALCNALILPKNVNQLIVAHGPYRLRIHSSSASAPHRSGLMSSLRVARSDAPPS